MGGLTVRGPAVRLLVREAHFLLQAYPCSPQARPWFPPSPPLMCVLPGSPRQLLLGASALLACAPMFPGAVACSPRVRSRRPETRVRLRRTWRVTGNMGLSYEV